MVRFINGHDGGTAPVLRVMLEGHAAEHGQNITAVSMGNANEWIEPPFDASIRVLCVRADAMGAKVAHRLVATESRFVVIAAQLDGVAHPRVPHAARFTFRQIDRHLCPVQFIPYEVRWRSDLSAQPGRRYQRAITALAAKISTMQAEAAGTHRRH